MQRNVKEIQYLINKALERWEFMKCKDCNKEMHLDDVDFNFKGNKDNYWFCDICGMFAFEKIRYGKTVKIEWEDRK